MRELADTFEGFPPYAPCCKALVLMSAFRTGEMTALRRRDVDHKRKRVHVRTKTKASKRWVYPPDAACQVLIEDLGRADQSGLFSGDGPDGWVFASPRGRRMYPQSRRSC